MREPKLMLGLDLVKLIAEIDEFKGRWEALKTLSPDRLSAMRKVAAIESVGSSTRIEGEKKDRNHKPPVASERSAGFEMGLRGFGIATASGGWIEVGFGDSDGMAGPRGAQNGSFLGSPQAHALIDAGLLQRLS
jgi:hypothetical protein